VWIWCHKWKSIRSLQFVEITKSIIYKCEGIKWCIVSYDDKYLLISEYGSNISEEQSMKILRIMFDVKKTLELISLCQASYIVVTSLRHTLVLWRTWMSRCFDFCPIQRKWRKSSIDIHFEWITGKVVRFQKCILFWQFDWKHVWSFHIRLIDSAFWVFTPL